MTKSKKKNLRIAIMVGREIASYYNNLHKGFKDIGVESTLFYERSHPFYEQSQNKSLFEKVIIKLNDIIVSPQNTSLKKILLFAALYPFVWLIKFLIFPCFLKKYDAFIFGANYSYLGFYLDRTVLKFFNKTIIDVTTGSDVRPPYLNGSHTNKPVDVIYKDTFKKFKKINRKNRYSTFIIDHPTVSQFSTREYIPFLYMGLPTCLAPQQQIMKRKKPLILHVPSNPQIKGTAIIRKAIRELQADYDFDYEELTGISNQKVLEKIQQCSFVVNQLYSDTPMSTLDSEAAWYGRASIVGGYNLEMVVNTINGYEIPPTYRIYPSKDNLKKAIIHLLTDTEYCLRLGNAAQRFVQKNWQPRQVAKKYLDIIQGDIPQKIIRTGYDDFDIYGCGIKKEDSQHIIKEMMSKYGETSLRLSEKPKLKVMIVNNPRTEL